jgi:hypothetical protein
MLVLRPAVHPKLRAMPAPSARLNWRWTMHDGDAVERVIPEPRPAMVRTRNLYPVRFDPRRDAVQQVAGPLWLRHRSV